jgi:hypothetical protein
MKDAGEALQWFLRAAKTRNLVALKNAAWILATNPSAEIRNASRAVELAQQAVAATERKDPRMLDTLAAALAEAARFKEAAAVEKEAIACALADADVAEFEGRLKLYQSGVPFRAGP